MQSLPVVIIRCEENEIYQLDFRIETDNIRCFILLSGLRKCDKLIYFWCIQHLTFLKTRFELILNCFIAVCYILELKTCLIGLRKKKKVMF